MSTSTPLARALREFCADHLPEIRGMSPHTVCSYRDAFTLLLRFLAQRRRRSVVKLDFDDLAPDRIIAFLHHLETVRGNAATPQRRETRDLPPSTLSCASSRQIIPSTSNSASEFSR